MDLVNPTVVTGVMTQTDGADSGDFFYNLEGMFRFTVEYKSESSSDFEYVTDTSRAYGFEVSPDFKPSYIVVVSLPKSGLIAVCSSG